MRFSAKIEDPMSMKDFMSESYLLFNEAIRIYKVLFCGNEEVCLQDIVLFYTL